MKKVVKSDIKNEIKVLQKMLPWLQRGNLKEISYKPNQPAVKEYFPLDEAINSEYINVRLVKKGRRLCLLIDDLDTEAVIQTFQSDSPANVLVTYLLEERPGEIVKVIDMPDYIHKITGMKLKDIFRKMKYWKALEYYFLLHHDKQKFQITNRLILTKLETKRLFKAFGIEWRDSA